MSLFPLLQSNRLLIDDTLIRFNLDEYKPAQKLIDSRINNPQSFVALLGETSCGKSTILNGLIGKGILPASSIPTTGEVVEIQCVPGIVDEQFFGLNNDNTTIAISAEEFDTCTKEKNRMFQRLILRVPEFAYDFPGMSIFDTPGFGSIHEAHEEVLKGILPQCDCIIYIVSYRTGLHPEDSDFIHYLRETKDESTGIFLVINRAPIDVTYNDSRVKEIRAHFSELYSLDVPCFIIPTDNAEGGKLHASEILPKAPELWSALSDWLKRPERQENVYRGLLLLQLELLISIREEFFGLNFSMDEVLSLQAINENFVQKKSTFFSKISSCFDELRDVLPRIIENSRSRMVEELSTEIDRYGSWTQKDECSGFIRGHKMYLLNRKETTNISEYVYERIALLNNEIQDMLNTAIGDYERQIKEIDLTYSELLLDYGKLHIERVLLNTLCSSFARFGGRGGAKAGVTNVAKMGLKKVGNLFGKTFSAETHNGLASFIKRIGVNSSRALALAASAIAEAVIYIIDSATWKPLLKMEVNKALNKWKIDLNEYMQKDLRSLESQNYDSIYKLFSEFSSLTRQSVGNESALNKNELAQYTEAIETSITNTKIIFKEL